MPYFKDRLAGAERLSCHIVTIPSAAVTQALAAAGADCLIIDLSMARSTMLLRRR